MMKNINTLVMHRVVKDQIENFEDITQQTLIKILKNDLISFDTIDSAFKKENQKQNSICLTFDDGYSSDIEIVLPELQEINAAATFFIVKDYLGKDGYMTKDQVINLSNNNMQIGSHSLTHPNFLNIDSKKKTEELIYSKKFLEDLISKEITTFAFPFGFVDEDSVEKVFLAGYKYCCISKHGITNAHSNIIPRNSINGGMKISKIYKSMRPSFTTRFLWSIEDIIKPIIKKHTPNIYPKLRNFISKI
ncbi:MAG: hypothetical protein CMQ51_00095 [Gammaproteobacteria bacterium]|nr:hypothetical protein [Gammaproteobacteria bacterium]|tara:strand:- start:1032 stop:1775 length:744 start_codon:yes stop_codon:yes gene_type:complete